MDCQHSGELWLVRTQARRRQQELSSQPSFISAAEIKYPYKSQVREEALYFSSQFRLQYIIAGR